MKKSFSTFLCLLLVCFTLNAQYYTADRQASTASTKKFDLFQDWKQKIYFGGNIGFGAGSRNYLYLEVSPLVGYRITDRLSVGSTLTYIYLRQRLYYQFTNTNTVFGYNYRSNIFGFSPFSRMFLLDWLFLHAEYNIFSADVLKTRDIGPDYVYTKRELVSYPLFGGGFVYNFSQRGGIMFMVLYNPIYDNIRNKLPIYNSPIVTRVGFFF